MKHSWTVLFILFYIPFTISQDPDDYDYQNQPWEEDTRTTRRLESDIWWVTDAPTTPSSTALKTETGDPYSPAIIGGAAVNPPNKYPFVVSIQNRSWVHFCGGSLIGRNTVLTAAHCVVDQSRSTIGVVIGMYKLSKKQSWNKFQVKEIIIHEDYANNKDFPDFDIAILILTSDVRDGVRPIGLPANKHVNPNPLNSNAWLFSAGWGRTRNEDAKSVSDVLQQVSLKVMPNKLCRERMGVSVTWKQICVFNERNATCRGDSGGPLFSHQGKKQYILYGIVSFGHSKGCKSGGTANVFTRVSQFLPWIQRHRGD